MCSTALRACSGPNCYYAAAQSGLRLVSGRRASKSMAQFVLPPPGFRSVGAYDAWNGRKGLVKVQGILMEKADVVL